MCGDIHPNPGPNNQKTNKLEMCHCNIRSLNKEKMEHIKIDLEPKFDVITLSETWLKIV